MVSLQTEVPIPSSLRSNTAAIVNHNGAPHKLPLRRLRLRNCPQVPGYLATSNDLSLAGNSPYSVPSL
jgi:hypothetical protein